MTLWDRSNPSSPLNVYKDGTTLRVQVSSITFFKRSSGTEDLAQVRFVKSRRGANGAEQLSHWIATIQYVYATPATDPRMRRWNPLGFKIVDYRTEAEVLAPETASAGGPAVGAEATARGVP